MKTTENHAVDPNKFTAGEEYLLSTCRLRPKKEENIKKWYDYDKINEISEEINSAKRKKTLFDATIDVSIVNSTTLYTSTPLK